MYNSKIKNVSLFCLLFFSALQAQKWSTELRTAYFRPTSSILRGIYNNGGIEGELEVNYRFYKQVSAWGNVGMFLREGHSTAARTTTNIHIYPLNAGLKYTFDRGTISPYVGLGVNYTFVSTHDNNPAAPKTYHKKGYGFVTKSGLHFSLNEKWYINTFIDYSYTHVAIKGKKFLNGGGVRLGGGVGIYF